jgi:hypothetical protein
MKELPRHKKAFELWYADPKRNLTAVGRQLNISKQSITKWAKLFKWEERAAKRDEAADRRTDEKVAESTAEMNARHVREYKMLQGKALERLTKARIEKDRDAITALDTGIKGERMAKGEPTEVINNQVTGALTIEDIKNAVQLRRKQVKPAE